MRTELVSIPTGTEALDGLLYTPDRAPAKAGILLFHGNTNNFYTGPSRFLPPRLVEAGFACLAFNRRGHDILTTLEGKVAGGGAFQTAAEGAADNAYAAAFLAERGFSTPIVIGHSNGGTLAAQFAADHMDVQALVLLSAHVGGRDLYSRICAAGMMSGDLAQSHVDRARQMVAAGRGRDLLLLPNWHFVISAESLLDRLDNTPDLLAAAQRIRCPTLFVVGDQESPDIYPAEAFVEHVEGSQARIIRGGDHWYTGRKDVVADIVGTWLARLGVSSSRRAGESSRIRVRRVRESS